jgi:hypothetical protein
MMPDSNSPVTHGLAPTGPQLLELTIAPGDPVEMPGAPQACA